MKTVSILFLALSTALYAQNGCTVDPNTGKQSCPSIVYVNSDPTGQACTGLPNLQGKTSGTQYSCQNGHYAAIGGSYTLPIATTSVLGGIKPDGTTITVNGTTGVASTAASGTVNAGTTGQLAGYSTNGTTVSGFNLGANLNLSGNTINAVTGAGTAYNPNTYYVYGDSISAGGAVVTPSNAYDARIASFLGIASSTRRSFSGDQTCAWSARILALDSPGTLAQQPLRTLLYGSNDANAKGAGPYENVFKPCHQAAIAWLTIPQAFKVMGPTATATGTCAADTTYTPTNGESCTANGSTLTFSSAITTTGKPLYIWYRSIDSDTGTWTYAVDSGTAVAVSTASTPAIAAANSITTGIMLIRVPVSAGTHSVVFTQTNSGTMAILGIGTPSSNTATGANPYLVVGELPNQYNGNIQAAVNAYRADTDADVALLAGDGLAAILAPTGSYVQMTAAAGDSNFPTDSIHPSDLGHAELAAAFLSAINLKFQGNVPASTLTLTPLILNNTSHTVTASDGAIFCLSSPCTVTFPASGLQLGTTVLVYANGSTTLSGVIGPASLTPGSGVVVTQLNNLGQWWVTGSFGVPITNFTLGTPSFNCASHTVVLTDNALFCNNGTPTVTFPATGLPLGKSVVIYANGTPTILSGVSGATFIPANTGAVISQLNAVGQWYATALVPALSTPKGTPTYTAGTNVTSVACASGYTCTNTRGELTIVGGTATTGTIATVNFSTTLQAAPGLCKVNQNGGATLFAIGEGTPSTTSFTITAGISVSGATVTVDYNCLQ